MPGAHETVTATASCNYCGWRAQHRGPALEVAAFLRALVIAHVQERHADQHGVAHGVEIVDRLGDDIRRGPQ